MRVPIQLLDCEANKPIEAELFDEVTVEHFLETKREWRPLVIEAAKAMVLVGAPKESIPRHFHWDWSNKEADLRVLAYSFFGISCRGALQGIMKLATAGRSGRLSTQKGKPLVYVDYLETAPWNIRPLMAALGRGSKYAAVGTRLLEAAVAKSLDEDFKGRVALHSLSTSEQFYLKAGMTAVGRDPDKHDMLWCEFTPEQAKNFVS